jgi:hypothetical protein
MQKATCRLSLRGTVAMIGLMAVVAFLPGMAQGATGPARLQHLAAAQTKLLLSHLRTPLGEQTASPTRCHQGQDADGTQGTFLLPALAGGTGDVTFKCHIEAHRVLVDLGGAFATEDNHSTWTTANGDVLPFTKANLERICDDVLPRFYPAPAPATVDRKPLRGATAVSTRVFTSRVHRGTGSLYQDSVALGHRGRLATAYCGWKAIVPLRDGRHVIRVDLSAVAGSETVFTYRIKVHDD